MFAFYYSKLFAVVVFLLDFAVLFSISISTGFVYFFVHTIRIHKLYENVEILCYSTIWFCFGFFKTLTKKNLRKNEINLKNFLCEFSMLICMNICLQGASITNAENLRILFLNKKENPASSFFFFFRNQKKPRRYWT